jgi:hypothetical protein
MGPAFSAPECLPLAGTPEGLHRTFAFPLRCGSQHSSPPALLLLARWLPHARPKPTRAFTIRCRLSISATHTTRGHIRELRSFASYSLGVSPKLELLLGAKLRSLPEGNLLRLGILEPGAFSTFPEPENHPRARCHRAALLIGGSAHQRSQHGQDPVSSALRDKGRLLSRPDTFHRQGLKRATVGLLLSCKTASALAVTSASAMPLLPRPPVHLDG